eukprot:11942189-Alexandrium_andersonii.AAC.1
MAASSHAPDRASSIAATGTRVRPGGHGWPTAARLHPAMVTSSRPSGCASQCLVVAACGSSGP